MRLLSYHYKVHSKIQDARIASKVRKQVSKTTGKFKEFPMLRGRLKKKKKVSSHITIQFIYITDPKHHHFPESGQQWTDLDVRRLSMQVYCVFITS